MAFTEIDELLSRELVGCNIDRELSHAAVGLNAEHPFSWEEIQMRPKEDHGIVETRGSGYKTMKYEILHSGGFVRLYTLRGRCVIIIIIIIQHFVVSLPRIFSV